MLEFTEIAINLGEQHKFCILLEFSSSFLNGLMFVVDYKESFRKWVFRVQKSKQTEKSARFNLKQSEDNFVISGCLEMMTSFV